MDKRQEDALWTARYRSPIGGITLASDGEALVGLWFDGQKRFMAPFVGRETREESALPVFKRTREWLDAYFSGEAPGVTPSVRLVGSAFQRAVGEAMLAIPFGTTTTYGALGRVVAARLGVARTSAQGVGGAVGRNPISLIVPCHRVVGANGSLTGYAGGLERKAWLLEREGVDLEKNGLFLPEKD